MQSHLFTGTQPSSSLVLHYSGYGYARHGAPLELVRMLRHWRRTNANSPIILVFHELYAFSPTPWCASFWLSALQRYVCKLCARIGDRMLTTTSWNRDKLQTLVNVTHNHHTSPVFSTVGESPVCLEQQRRPIAVVFGLQENRCRLYQKHAEALGRWMNELSIELIVDIGPGDSHVPDILQGRVKPLGCLSIHEIREWLCRCRVGFLDYPVFCLAKSSIFAAYAAHGLVSVVFSEKYPQTDGLIPGRQYLPGHERSVDGHTELQRMSQALKQWYDGHNLDTTVGLLSEWIRDRSAGERH
ncbi:MAG TPA: hypothetical protein PKO06_16225 [Candidatus Ozemobacteraceae bacterium]|nr:hypothetical protein [Candidatus Ozemobacteraceae bacterium]